MYVVFIVYLFQFGHLSFIWSPSMSRGIHPSTLTLCPVFCDDSTRHVQNQIFIGRDWYVIYTRSWFRSCMGLRLRSRLGNFGKISRDFGKYSSRPGFSVYNLGKITEIWSRLIFFVYCSLNLNTVIVLLPRKQREKRTRSRISRSRRDLQWTEMDMSDLKHLNTAHN